MPTCPACHSDRTGYYFDPKTGRAVYQDAKALAKCHDCGDVFIAAGAALEKRIGLSFWQRWSRTITYLSGAAFSMLEYWFDIFWVGLAAQWALIAAIVFTALGISEILLARSLASGGVHILRSQSLWLRMLILFVRYALPIGLIVMGILFNMQQTRDIIESIQSDLPM